MVFGVFDQLHEGHLVFFAAARHYGGQLIAVVARDSFVREYKHREPYQNELDRLTCVKNVSRVDEVILGDEIQGSYETVKKYKPDVICLGYDQNTLASDLETRMRNGEITAIPVIRLESYKGEKFHSSLLNNHK